MTAPEPTAGERQWHDEWCPMNGCRCGKCGPCARMPECPAPPPPAVAASTGTSEDVEALAKVLQRGIFGDEQIMEAVREARRQDARAVLSSDWLAAREAAARAEERERIARAIEAHADRHAPAHTRRTFVAAARIAREGR